MKFYFTEPKVKFFSLAAIIAFLIIVILDVCDSKFAWHDILVESHGLFYDLIVFGILLTVYESIRSKKELIARYTEEIDDYRFWENDEARFRIRGIIRRLVKLGITTFDLSHCFLKTEKSLSQFDNISGSKFSGANLSEAWFVMCNISNSEFYHTNLSYSVISKVNLSFSKMGSANLSNANLAEVNFSDVDLNKADLSNAIVVDCVFKGTNFTDAKLDNAIVSDESWFAKLQEWNVGGYEGVLLRYEIEEQATIENNRRMYRIKLKPGNP